MLSLRAHAIICASLFVALFGLAIAGNVLQAAGVIHTLGIYQLPVQILFFSLFLAFGFSAIPVMVKLVLGVQERMGNSNAPVIGGMIRYQNTIILVIWGLLAAGLVVALPAAIAGGLFAASPAP